MNDERNSQYVCTDVGQVRAAFNDISMFRTEDSRFMAQALLFLCERNMKLPKSSAQAAREYQESVDIASTIENENDLNDGGYFEAGFIAAKTKIVDALIQARDNTQLNSRA